MGLPHGVSPKSFYVHIQFSLYIFKSSLLIFKHKQTSFVCFHSFVYPPSNGPPSRCKSQHSLCTYIFSLYISNTFHVKYKFLSVHNTDTFSSNTDKLRSFVSVSSVYTTEYHWY